MSNLKSIFYFLSLILLVSCKGTDVLDDPIVNPKFTLNKTEVILRVGEEYTFTAKYFDEYGIEKIVPFIWGSTQPLNVKVDSHGKITALKAGSAEIYPQFQNLIGNAANITVVANDNAVAKVTISASKTNLALNESINLGIMAQNIGGQTVNGSTIQWFSENEAILKVDANGKATAIANGIAGIHGKIDGVKSNSIDFKVGTTDLTGTFVSAGGYKAVGTATLKNINGSIILDFASNFETSYALGTFVYLANSTNGATVRASGLEIAEIKSDGAKSFNVSQVKSNISLNDYKYVIILCKPASVSFGYAELK
jgi:hypothetical protein